MLAQFNTESLNFKSVVHKIIKKTVNLFVNKSN